VCAISGISQGPGLPPAGILHLEEMVKALPAAERRRFRRLFTVDTACGELNIPPQAREMVVRQFGSLEAVACQRVVKVTNRISGEGTIFNRLRAFRPRDNEAKGDLDRLLEASCAGDPFRAPLTGTPEEPFGRLRGKYCVTAGNAAKCDGLHGLVIFDQYNPLHFTREQVKDYIDTGLAWARRAQSYDPAACYFLFIWNCLWRAGASINHGHAQLLLGRGRHYSRIEALRRVAQEYHRRYRVGYFEDLFGAHRALGCGMAVDGVRVLVLLTPFKNNEVMLMADRLDEALKERIYDVLAFLRDEVGVASFDLSLMPPPLGETPESWAGFPVLVRVVDRGNLLDRSSDVGSAEIYAQSVASTDPIEMGARLKQSLGA
jgi:hypothetical protein